MKTVEKTQRRKETTVETSKFNNNKLRGRIVEKYGTISSFCEAIGMNRSVMSKKLNGRSALTRTDIAMICPALEIPNDEIAVYFFTK